jgi:hypothetical protein
MVDLPNWTDNLKPLYCRLRLSKHNGALRRRYYREIEKEKLRLAEEGVNQDKIRLACRFLSNTNYMRGNISTNAMEVVEFLNESDKQMILPFHH